MPAMPPQLASVQHGKGGAASCAYLTCSAGSAAFPLAWNGLADSRRSASAKSNHSAKQYSGNTGPMFGFTMTSVHSQLNLFGDNAKPLTLSSAASLSLVKMSPVPGAGRASRKAHARACGARLSGSFADADPRWSCLRTSLLSALAGTTGLPMRWNESATPSNRSWWVLGRSARPTSGTGFGLWPTVHGNGGNNGPTGTELGYAVGHWATPVAHPANGMPEDFLRRKRESVARGNKMGICLTDLQMQVQAWPTASASDAKRGGVYMGGNPTLAGAVQQWPTPSAADEKNTADAATGQAPNLRHMLSVLSGQPAPTSPSTNGKSQDWPTPNVPTRGPESREAKAQRGSGGVDFQTKAGRHLNSRWVAQLMGYPSDWCAVPTNSLSSPTATPSAPKSSAPSPVPCGRRGSDREA